MWLAAPILLFFWLCAYIKNRTLPRKVHEIDVDVRFRTPPLVCLFPRTALPHADPLLPSAQTGRKTWFTAEEMNAYRAERKAAPFYIRVYRILFTN